MGGGCAVATASLSDFMGDSSSIVSSGLIYAIIALVVFVILLFVIGKHISNPFKFLLGQIGL